MEGGCATDGVRGDVEGIARDDGVVSNSGEVDGEVKIQGVARGDVRGSEGPAADAITSAIDIGGRRRWGRVKLQITQREVEVRKGVVREGSNSDVTWEEMDVTQKAC